MHSTVVLAQLNQHPMQKATKDAHVGTGKALNKTNIFAFSKDCQSYHSCLVARAWNTILHKKCIVLLVLCREDAVEQAS